MKIADINAKIILDSRRKETIEVGLRAADFLSKASVPSGKSRGRHEAFVLEPRQAMEKLSEIKPLILSASAGGRIENQRDFDNFLISLDASENKENLGGNLILALSLAFARLKAKSENLELFEYIRDNFQLPITLLRSNSPKGHYKLPRPIFNVINGGAHSAQPKSRLAFQEFQVIPTLNDFKIAFAVGKEFYFKLGNVLDKRFGADVRLGDEAGYSAPFKNNEEALEVLYELILKHRYPLKIGLDAAASQFYKSDAAGKKSKKTQGFYLIDGKQIAAAELKDLYASMVRAYDIVSIEDPFEEESFEDFADLLARTSAQTEEKILIIADDLTVTNSKRLKTAIDKKSGNAILIKPNQIGTLTETLDVVELARQNGWQSVVSHRSGETMDDFIADLAVGVGAWGVKAGAPAKEERLAKYDRLLEISQKILQ
ncbi:phosphopyruvate hydratase [Candidatus Wolfebacteria bacterium]|nr:phosphopyruvate hydratase [Candidatus Wolfebacteria bacterium]